MMAYHQRYNQFRSRIDFDDPSTTKPQSLAKSAVLQALEEEERQQSRANKGWQRPSRSRQREEPAMPRPNSRTPCIDRDTVMRINRRPVRHRSCDNFWPPAPRTPSPLERTRGHSAVGESEGGSFAYDGVRRYGSNESVYFDVDKVCKQHKIDPLRTKFDKANVVLVDWGRRGGGFHDNGSHDKRCREKADDTANNSINRGKNIESEKRPSEPRVVSDDVKGKSNDDGVVLVEQKSKPPSPPPRRYFLPIDQQYSGVGVEILLRCYKLNPEQDERLNDSSSQTIDNYQDKDKAFNPVTVPPAASIPDGDGILHQDGIQSKPPLKTKSTSTKRTILSSKPPTPVHFSVSPIGLQSSDNPVPGERNEFNINSDTILNLNIDTGFSRRMPPQITVTECRDQTTNTTTNHFDKRHSMGHQQQQTASLKTSDQLLNEIIDENHNYNEKLITNSGRSDTESHPTTSSAFTESDRQCRAQEFPNEQHSKLNVSNQPNRNWINLNSNEIHPYADGGSSASATTTTTPLDEPAAQWGEDSPSAPATSGARMTQTRVVLCNSIATEASDTVSHPLAEPNDRPPKATHVASDDDSGVRHNYDNKSVKSNYWDPIPSGSKRSEQRPGRLERSDSRDSSRSWRFDEVLEFPPPPPYLCLCEDESIPSGRCSEERSTRGSSDSGVPAGNHPTLLQSPSVPLVPATYERWVHFDNGNISPPPAADQHRSPTPVRIPTPYPSPTHSGEPDDQPQCHQNVFDQFAAAFDEHQPQSKPASVDFVENVPLIDAVLDDLLTFSKTLVLRQSPVLSCPRDFPLAKEREEAKIVEINDDNLINLLADDDDNSIATKGVDETGRGLASERKTLPSKQDSTEDDASGLGWQQENSGNESFPEGKCDLNANEGRTQLEPKDHNRSADDSKDVIDNYLSTRRNHEDIFANVAIFNWNPLDVYHQHGLFMIDPRFALADLHATIPEDFSSTTHGQDDSYNERQSRASNEGHMRNDAHLNSPKLSAVQIQQDDGDTAAIGTVGITDGADPSSVDVNSFATQLADPATGDGCLLESHKIPNDRASSRSRSPAAVDHFYDSAHVEYPVRADLCSATIQDSHQSPKESDYDNDPAKNITTGSRRSSRGSSNGSCSRRSSLQRTENSTSSSTGRDETEGLKRVAWPPPAELGDGEYQYQQQQPVQQPQQPYHYPPQQQQNQQPFQQQQHYQPAHTQPQQQHQPRERIIPIQRATSHTSPLHTPKSPVNQLKYPSYPPSSPQHLTHQQPQYQQPQQQQGGSSTVAFSGGRAVLPQKQQPARPVSAPYYQQQQQQQNRYSSPSTASLASPRSPHPIGGGQSPRGWAHVQSPVPVYRPTPQQQQQNQYQQQPYVPPPFQTQPAPYQQQQHQRPTSGASAGYGHGYGPRKPEPSTQQPQYQPQPTQAFQPLVSSQQQQQQLYQQPEAIPQQQQHQQFYQTTAADSQIPFVTTLRKEAPMSQEPSPVYQSEPVAAIYQGGTNMRGDQKWPPADYKKQSDLENEERRKLAQQPAFRPRKVQKDYSDFFAKNALNATYPGYRAPPGTQHHS